VRRAGGVGWGDYTCETRQSERLADMLLDASLGMSRVHFMICFAEEAFGDLKAAAFALDGSHECQQNRRVIIFAVFRAVFFRFQYRPAVIFQWCT
jgi:hypothetical protein